MPTTDKRNRPADAALERYREARAEALAQFARSNRVEPLWHSLTAATDALLSAVPLPAGLTLVATGGYGRGELFPYSDIDVLVLVTSQRQGADLASIALLQHLWDLGIPVSHATRTADECVAAAHADATNAASLMHARLIAGDKLAFRALKKRLKQEVFGSEKASFIATKLDERELRHARWGDSRFLLEPNIKEGKGGLRDLHTLQWISDYCYGDRRPLLTEEEWRHYRQAYLFFAVLRAHMHQLRGRADERLTFDLQKEIAGRLKFRGRTAQEKAERFMRRYFQMARVTGLLTRIFCAGLEEENLRPLPAPSPAPDNVALPASFSAEGGRINFAVPEALAEAPALAVSLFAHAARHGLDIHPRAYLAIARALPQLSRRLVFEGAAGQEFMDMLLAAESPELHLRRLNEAGVLGALIPEFARITGMMQYDGYHTYTVDEHMLVAVGNLAQLRYGKLAAEVPLSSQVAHEITQWRALYLATLCHDIAKGTGGGHEEKGGAVITRIAQRMGLTAEEIALADWLVRHQSLLTETAFKRDLEDPATIAHVVDLARSPDRLRLLLLLTVADVKAVGPTIWNGWKGALLRDLYRRVMAAMGITVSVSGIALDLPNSPTADHLPPIAAEAFATWQQSPSAPALVVQHDRFRAVTEIACVSRHTPALFRHLAGVMAWLGASIVAARLLVHHSGAAIITLAVQDIQGISFADDTKRLAPLAKLLTEAGEGKLDFAAELPKRRRLQPGGEVAIPTSVLVDHQSSGQASVIEVHTRDRLGLLYDLLGAFEECGCEVRSAQLATYGRKAVDVFYITGRDGQRITDPVAITRLTRVLLDSGNGIALDYAI